MNKTETLNKNDIKALEKEEKERQRSLKALQDRGFKNYTYDIGDKSLKTATQLVPNKCKNLTGKTNTGYFVQTKDGKDLATKLTIREMRKTIKEYRGLIKDIKSSVDTLKKALPKPKKVKECKDEK